MRKKKKSIFNRKKITTTKRIVAFLFITCTLLIIFTCGITVWQMFLAQNLMMVPDFTPLITILGVVIGEVIGFAVYAVKSLKENTKGGIVYDTAMKEYDDNTDDPMNTR